MEGSGALRRQVTVDLPRATNIEEKNEEDQADDLWRDQDITSEREEQPNRIGSARPSPRDSAPSQSVACHRSQSQKGMLNADSDEMNIDALLKAVLDISDRLQDQEVKLAKEGAALKEREARLKRAEMKRRPKTAMLQYRRDDDDDDEKFDDDPDALDSFRSDILLTPQSSKSVTGRGSCVANGKRPTSGDVRSSTSSRQNMSFSNDRVGRIDHENQRLLREIMRNKAKSSQSGRSAPGPVRVASVSAVNRNFKQEKIDRENLMMLRRLETAKPTAGLSRNNLLTEHEKSSEHRQRIAKTSAARPQSAGPLNSHTLLAMSPKRTSSKSVRSGSAKGSSAGSIASSSHLSMASSRGARSNSVSRSSVSTATGSRSSNRKLRTVAVWESGW